MIINYLQKNEKESTIYLPLWRGLGGGKTAESPPPSPLQRGRLILVLTSILFASDY